MIDTRTHDYYLCFRVGVEIVREVNTTEELPQAEKYHLQASLAVSGSWIRARAGLVAEGT